MLERLRVHVKGWLGMAILILISIPFALFGLQNYTSGGSEQPVAEVGDVKIYQADVNRAYQNRVSQLKDQYGEQYSPDLFNEAAVRQESLNRLVQEQLISQTVAKDGYVASDRAVLDVISKLEAFQKDGQFDKATYEQLLQMQGLTTTGFIESVRLGIEREQFINSIVDTTLVDDSEVEDFYRLTNQTRDIRYLLLPVSSVMAEVTVTDEEIEKNYAQNEHLYKTPEVALIDYVELSLANLMTDINPSDEALLAFYESEKQSFMVAGHRRASHILFEVPEGTSIDDAEIKRAQAEEALSRIKNGEEFSVIAEEVSEDIGSAKLGGDLGIITEGMMDAEFEKALATLKEGEVSEVIQTVYGFQIIKLVSKEADTIEPFEQVKEKVTELFKRDIAGEKFDQLAERFAALSFENPDSLEPLADELGLKIQQQSGITQLNGEGIASNDKVRHAVFKEDVLAGNNSEVLELNSEHFVVLRVNLHTPEEVLPLEAVKSSVELSVKKEKSQRLLKDKAAGFLTKETSGVSFNELASQDGVLLEDVGPVTRNDQSTPAKLLREAFSMPHPNEEERKYKLTTLDNGDFAVIELAKVTDGDVSEIDEESLQSFKVFLARLTGEVTLAASLANLSVDADVVFADQSE